MFDQLETPTAVIRLFPPEYRPTSPAAIQSMGGAGGFSGARFWRYQAAAGSLCLRRWPPEHPSESQLQWIHRVLLHARDAGCEFLPVPISPRDSVTGGASDTLSDLTSTERFVRLDDHLWELTAWLSGTPSLTSSPSPNTIRAALHALARFHSATRSFHCVTGRSPGIKSRIEFTNRLLQSQLSEWQTALPNFAHHIHYDACREVLRLSGNRLPALQEQLLQFRDAELTLQPCIRDIRPEHVLFEEERVRGIVDFAAMRVDNVATDIARLLGGIHNAHRAAAVWHAGLEAYEEISPLSDIERLAIGYFHRANVALSGLNWVQWLIVEGRQFTDDVAVSVRLRQILATLSRDSDEVILL